LSVIEKIEQVYLVSLEGLGSSYRLKGYFTLKSKNELLKVPFEGVAFGGNYGGHNVNVTIENAERSSIESSGVTSEEIEELLTEVQRRLLNNEMIVDYSEIKRDDQSNHGLP
jgi:hypothetical protein